MAHIGVGAFHRCHQAEYADDMLEARFGPYGIVGVNLAGPRLADLLAPQDGLFSRTLREGGRAETRVVGAIRRVIDVEDAISAEAAVAALAAPAVQVVTMTVTEKGYCLTPATGALDRDNPALAADLSGGFPPRTLLGLLALALERRRQANGEGLTLISCDNIPMNGARLRGAIIAFAAARSAGLARWIESRVAFPATMVDRIVPATTAEDIEAVSAALGVRDEAAVVGEPFRQWVIEDSFAAGRPPWDLAGAAFVTDARPYEQIKMRVLNAAQSTLSHQGALVGHAFSFEAAADPVLSALTRRMLERETASTLPSAPGMEADSYIGTSLSRIRNPAIRHRCHQIGTDGSQKIVQRLARPVARKACRRSLRGVAHSVGRELDGLCPQGIAPIWRGLEALRSMGRHNDRDRRPDARLPRHGQSHSRHRADFRRRSHAGGPRPSDSAALGRPAGARPARLPRRMARQWLSSQPAPAGAPLWMKITGRPHDANSSELFSWQISSATPTDGPTKARFD